MSQGVSDWNRRKSDGGEFNLSCQFPKREEGLLGKTLQQQAPKGRKRRKSEKKKGQKPVNKKGL